MSYYDCLGISKNATSDEIKKAFRKKSLICHPDKHTGNAEEFKKINEAYQTLSDEHKKRVYDLRQSGSVGGSNNGFNPQNMNEVMSMFFQNGFNGRPSNGFNMHSNNGFKVFYDDRRVKKQNPAIIKRVSISLQQSYSGGVLSLEIDRWINIDNVKTSEKENIYVKFPRGIDNNEIILLKGKGHHYEQAEPGDIKVVFIIKNDTQFIRKGVDLIYNKLISLKEALTGLEMDIDHINGKKYKVDTVKNFCIINDNTNTNLPNLGMTRENITGKLIINFKVEFPKTISMEDRDKLKDCL